MKRFLLAAMLTAGATGAYAQVADCTTDPVTGNMFCDPTAFHVSSPSATGSDPVLLNDSNTFTISVVGNHTINQPIRVYFIEPLGSVLPDITSAVGLGSGGAFSVGVTGTATATAFNQTNGLFDGPTVTISSSQDFGKAMNLKGADASLSYANFKAEYTLLGLAVPTTFQVEDAVFNLGMNSNADFLTVNGAFGLGTIIAPLAVDVAVGRNGKLTVTTFDTSWTNAGLVNATGAVPEPGTWAMLMGGFGLMALVGYRSRRNRLAGIV